MKEKPSIPISPVLRGEVEDLRSLRSLVSAQWPE
jgi:hypothetical protein